MPPAVESASIIYFGSDKRRRVLCLSPAGLSVPIRFACVGLDLHTYNNPNLYKHVGLIVRTDNYINP